MVNNIKKLRKQLNYSQEQLGKLLNVSRNTISQYESDDREPSFKLLFKMADIFNVSIDELLGRKEKTNITDIKLTDYQQEIYNLLPFLNQIQCQAIKSMIDAFNVEPEVEDKEIFDLIKKHGDK